MQRLQRRRQCHTNCVLCLRRRHHQRQVDRRTIHHALRADHPIALRAQRGAIEAEDLAVEWHTCQSLDAAHQLAYRVACTGCHRD